MNMTHHFDCRMNQRGIRKGLTDLALDLGEIEEVVDELQQAQRVHVHRLQVAAQGFGDRTELTAEDGLERRQGEGQRGAQLVVTYQRVKSYGLAKSPRSWKVLGAPCSAHPSRKGIARFRS